MRAEVYQINSNKQAPSPFSHSLKIFAGGAIEDECLDLAEPYIVAVTGQEINTHGVMHWV